MSAIIALIPAQFSRQPMELFRNEYFTVISSKFTSGIEAITIKNNRGSITVLPYYGQIIWDAEFDGLALKMASMFTEPKYGHDITDTYGCFAFHSGLLSNGCPSPQDKHIMHGEMACAKLDSAWLEVKDNHITLCGSMEYIKGFGAHYIAKPSVQLTADSSLFNINMQVTNLGHADMPLQYMCHMNYTYINDATLTQNIPDRAFELRQTIPSHVHPTEQWLNYTQQLSTNEKGLSKLNEPQFYDPEIVFLADNLCQYTEHAEFFMHLPQGQRLVSRFSTQQFNYATRWILYNGDQKVAAFILPVTCRPEGFLAAQANRSLIILASGETRQFSVTTGIENTEQ